MKQIHILPITEEKLTSYIRGELKLVKKRKTGRHMFKVISPRGGTTAPHRKAYYRVWYFRKNLPDLPEVTLALDDLYKKLFPESYRGRRGLASVPRPAIQSILKSNGKAPRSYRMPKSHIRAYRKGYNAAYRSQEAKFRALLLANKVAARVPSQANHVRLKPKKTFGDAIAGFFGRLSFD